MGARRFRAALETVRTLMSVSCCTDNRGPVKLTSLEIRNFRSIEHLKVEDLNPFTIFIGPNNSGKSTIFRAIQSVAMILGGAHWFRTSDRSAYASEDTIHIRAEFSIAPPERSEVLGRVYQRAGKVNPREWARALDAAVSEHLTSVNIEIAAQPGTSQPDSYWGYTIQNRYPAEFDHTLQEAVATIIATETKSRGGQYSPDLVTAGLIDYVTSSVRSIIPSRLKFLGPIRNPDPRVEAVASQDFGDDASDFLRSVYHHRGDDTPEYREWRALVQQVFPQLEEILVPPSEKTTNVSLGVKERGIGHPVNMDSMSSGLQEALVILARIVFSPPGCVIAIEEPEIHFHGDSLKKIATLLTEASATKQVLISTHSGFFIVDDIRREPEEIVEVCRTAEHGTRAIRLATEKDVDRAYFRLQGLHSAEPASGGQG